LLEECGQLIGKAVRLDEHLMETLKTFTEDAFGSVSVFLTLNLPSLLF